MSILTHFPHIKPSCKACPELAEGTGVAPTISDDLWKLDNADRPKRVSCTKA
ncbi:MULTISPECIES: hypothetical protein [unclassified Microcoleus]|uniref:hypothetical protein n=1 Tax=unclassified Microcoleus TaxID=2642155 RepID=UPI001E19F10D|nr:MULTISPECIES: hypothetical protein [unclassified Microcoleus]MCC3623338.1 hypothetical protein [Microcoleus sp. PH2017_36_ELK_O_B]